MFSRFRLGRRIVALCLTSAAFAASQPPASAARSARTPAPLFGITAVQADSQEPGNEAANAFDGDPKTIWQTPRRPQATAYPHYLRFEYPTPHRLRGFTALPRQDGTRTGWICDFAFYASDDGVHWGEPVARGSFRATRDAQTVLFPQPVSGRCFMFAALQSFGRQFASLAELTPLEADSASTTGASTSGGGVHAITIDGRSAGLTFDGVGAVSAGGSSRLLVDYPEPERSQILDYLFKPNYGAALQILKVEIGADTDATCGAEPSCLRSPDKVEPDLGYEWWLMKEAKARNPDLKLCGLAWGAPGWVKGGFWSDDNIRQLITWLDCAKQHGLHIDYLGGGNERGWDATYYIKLRKALNEHGYAHIKIVATDDHSPPDYWASAAEMKKNRAFADAVDVLGQHDFCVWRTEQRHCYVSDVARSLGKPIWDSENSTQDYAAGFAPLARAMNRHYIEGRVTGNLNWALVGAYYGTFRAPGTGLLLADRPWSGWYDVGRSVWIDAHTTQFTKPGWRYVDSACGYSPGGASYVALRAASGDDYALVIETMDLVSSETFEVSVAGELSTAEAHVWSTDLRSERDSDHFVRTRTLRPANGRYSVTLEPGHVYTVSTTTGQHKGNARPRATSDQRLPLPFREDFEHTGDDRLAAYFSDVHGGFQAVLAGGGRSGWAYRQMVTQEPILWHNTKLPPTTLVGDPQWWGDYDVSVDALLEGPGYVELLGRIDQQAHNAAGYHLRVSDTGRWSLFEQSSKGENRTLAEGEGATMPLNTWHRLELQFVGGQITATVDGKALASVRDDVHNTGQVGLRVSPWQHAQFDNLSVTRSAPWPALVPRGDMRVAASSEHGEIDFGALHLAQQAIDDRVETTWASEYCPPAPLPQSITVDLGKARSIAGLLYRSPLGAGTGTITRYIVYVSSDGASFTRVGGGDWRRTSATKSVSWPRVDARFVKLEALDAERNRAAAAEINIVSADDGA